MDLDSYAEHLNLLPRGDDANVAVETQVTTPSQTNPDENEVEEEVPWSNFKPQHGNTGMQKFGGRPKGSLNGDQGLKHWQMRIVDFMIENPSAKRPEIAAHVGVTPEWLSRVMNSDAFLKYRDIRIKDHQQTLSEKIVAKAGETALNGLEKLNNRIKNESDSVATSDLVKATEMSGKMLGLGTAVKINGGGGNVQVNNFGVNPSLLAAARRSMELIGEENTRLRIEAEGGDDDEDLMNTLEHQDYSMITSVSHLEETEEELKEGDEERELLDKVAEAQRREDMDTSF